ncbi:putative extracellular sulfatase Sulf-1 homolog isoform X2 [Mizuhopecten yessoensis]|uniref:putative extracellular sulfatase Sulf-1 homolog isoform X2 n=1 Tax=Mizuhopecten yessoensis TaxID=6573 RepID=UPI000B45C3A3|nr:putative extracellular sulfatase Sulf-1 homolog isoform X2 [Mizuhopecten yessoensis]
MTSTIHVSYLLLIVGILAWCATAWVDSTPRRPNRRKNKQTKPNIIVIMTDDQDILLGSMEVMPKTLRIMRDQGLEFNNSFVSSPMCCPSRSSFLTGLYPHNHNVYTNNENCSGDYWIQNHEPNTFATYLNNAGYRTGYFGKYLNKYNGSYIPPGWREWVGLVRNSRFYNYSINFNGNKMEHGDNYYGDYLTDLIANDSVTFLKQSKEYFKRRPVLMVLSTPAPHGPEDSAPQYQHLFYNNTLHRTPTWNMAPNLDKQYLLKITKQMEPIHQKFTDVLQQKRLQTLQSVDDLVEKVYTELWMLGELDNTYIIYTSDHGYHLGQYGVIKGKGLPYDFDIRVPLYIRGPGIKPRSRVSNVVMNVDLAPTILDMAGVPIPDHMDGRSILKLIKSYKDSTSVDDKEFVQMKKPWRDTVLLERGKITKNKQKILMKEQNQLFLDNLSNMDNIPPQILQYATRKQRRILKQCSKSKNKPPCKVGQRYQCIQEPGRKLPRLQKCRSKDLALGQNVQGDSPYPTMQQKPCRCPPMMNAQERRNQEQFLLNHVNKDFKPKFISRRKRQLPYDLVDDPFSDDFNEQYPQMELFEPRCRELPNNTIMCDQELYNNVDAWKNHKGQLDEMIQEYRKMLEDLRTYRRHLKTTKPKDSYLSQFGDDESGPGYLDNTDGYLSPDLTDPDCDCDDNLPGTIQEKRQRRKDKRKERKRRKFRKRRKNKDCNKPDMNCFTHDHTHWRTPPLWDSRTWNLPPNTKMRRMNHPACKRGQMECYLMDDTHWKTPPLWTYGPFCYCTNSNNNTYWCLRTVNQTHDLLYCEFINNFISYYDLLTDPFQEVNTIHQVNYGVLQQLHDQLNEMRACKGHRECDKAGTLKERRNRDNFDDDDDFNDEELNDYIDNGNTDFS